MSVTFVAPKAVLPGKSEPVPATVTVDINTGKITDVKEGVHEASGDVVKVPEHQVLLPGLIE